MQNLVRLYTTSNFDREYLRNQTRYPKLERYVINIDSHRVQRNKSGELWSPIQKVEHVSLDPRKTIFRETTFRPLWGAGPSNLYRYVIENDSSRVQGNKSGELWSTIHKVVYVSFYPPKLTFSVDYISAPRECWPLKCLHTLHTSQGLLAHTTNRVGVPPPQKKN